MSASRGEGGVKPLVVYIMGTGRSGSTVLGITLGNLDEAFYVGEAFSWAHFSGKPMSDDPDTVALWEEIREGIPRAEEYFALDFFHRIEHHSSLIRFWKRGEPDLAEAYRRCTSELFRSVSEATGAHILIDSSHFPLRALRLLGNFDVDVFLLYLVRDPIDVINALQSDVQRHRPMKPWVANAYTLWVWLLSEWVFRRARRASRMKLRYEDFVSNPARWVGEICSAIGVPNTIGSYDALRTDRIFQGNRVRAERTIALKPPERKNRLGSGWDRLSRILQYPMRRLYGYGSDR